MWDLAGSFCLFFLVFFFCFAVTVKHLYLVLTVCLNIVISVETLISLH